MDPQYSDQQNRPAQAVKVNESKVEWEERRSPNGTYHLFQRNLSLVLCGKKDIGEWGGGHPFDVAMVRMPSGAMNFPRHVHSTTWEYYLIATGHGEIEIDDETFGIDPGDHIVCPPGSVHRIHNTGGEELVYYVIADNPKAEVVYYPGSDKWMTKPQRKWFRMTEVDYYDGED